MNKDSITPIKPSTGAIPVTLNEVRDRLNDWRSSKKKQNEKIPQVLWEQIFMLFSRYPKSKVRSALSLTSTQIARALALDPNPIKTAKPIDFCQVRQDANQTVVTPLFDVKAESKLSEDEWFAKEIQEEKLDQATKNQKPTTPLAYKPAEAFSTATSVVELRRPDGMLMKIHICTDRFEELLRAFFKV
jgi:hypothetical protein